MKKYLYTYGVLILYLGLTFGLDKYLGLKPKNIGLSNEIALGERFTTVRTWIWVIFAALSLLYIWYSLNIKSGDKVFFIVQIILGALGIITIVSFSNFSFSTVSTWERISRAIPFSWILRGITKGSGGLIDIYTFIFTFIAGLGLMGFLKLMFEKEKIG